MTHDDRNQLAFLLRRLELAAKDPWEQSEGALAALHDAASAVAEASADLLADARAMVAQMGGEEANARARIHLVGMNALEKLGEAMSIIEATDARARVHRTADTFDVEALILSNGANEKV